MTYKTMRKNLQQKGSTQGIFLIIIIIILLYLNFHKLPQSIQNLFSIFTIAWNTYIEPLFKYLWTSITALFK